MQPDIGMAALIRSLVVAVVACLAAPCLAAAADATLFRLFLKDGSVLVSYGEFARVDDRVVFSMPVGGTPDQPRLQIVTLRSALVDWGRTESYAASARYQRYAETRGEEDFQILSNEISTVLNDIALSKDRQKALVLAERARKTIASWPKDHYGYRQNDVMEIVSLLDEAISSLRNVTGASSFELSLVAMAAPVPLEPVLGMPTPRQQVDQILRAANVIGQASERMALLQSALALINESSAVLTPGDAASLRKAVDRQIRQELNVDAKYAKLTQRVNLRATQAAADARITDVEKLLDRLPKEDAKLGMLRPEVMESLQASVRQNLQSARRLRLLRDQWLVRRAATRDYQRSVGDELVILSKAQPLLEAIRRLEGPEPDRLVELRSQLSGGADRLQRLRTPEHLRMAHELLVGAWRFAENAVKARYDAIASASVGTAWEASSAAAGALMMLTRAQQEMRTISEPPKLR